MMGCRICGEREPMPGCIVCHVCLKRGHDEWNVQYSKLSDPEDIGQHKVVKIDDLMAMIKELVEAGYYIDHACPRGM